MESIIGVIENVESIPPNCYVKKNCNLIITNKRIICLVLGPSVFISAMIGQALNGVPGAIGFGIDAKNKIEEKNNITDELNDMLQKNSDIFSINIEEINENKSTYKTGFWSTLGLFAQLRIITRDGKKYVFDTPNNTKSISKEILREATSKIAIS